MITKELMRARAAQYRRFAAGSVDPELRSALIALAEAYERVAQQLDSPAATS